MTAGVGTAAAIASLVADVSQWTTRLSREVKSVVRTSSNLGDLFRRARTAIDDLAATAEHGLAGLAGQPALATAAAGGTRGARGASRSAHGARGGRGAGTTGHNSGTGSTGGRRGGKGTGGGKGHGGAGHGGGGTGHGTAGGDKTPDPEMTRRSQEAQQRAQNTHRQISEKTKTIKIRRLRRTIVRLSVAGARIGVPRRVSRSPMSMRSSPSRRRSATPSNAPV